MTTNKKLNIGLFGFGVVGEGIYQVLEQTPTLNASIKKIAIKHSHKKRNAPSELFTTNADDLLNDESINVIVELIDDAEAAYKIVTTALKNKKHVVSANKKMIATHLQELIQLQTENNVSLLYEAAVCGSIPVIRNLEEYYDNDLLHSFSGIVNGSTNFILTKMNKEKLDYTTALHQAKELGFAESNPALDVEGIDAVNKLTIVLKHAYGIHVLPNTILHKGITQLHESDTKYAFEKGYTTKLVAKAIHIDSNKIAAYVLPTFIENTSQLFSVNNEFNGVLIGSKLSDEQFLYGKGAGRFPTSSAVLSDIAALRYNYQYEYKKSNTGIDYQLCNKTYIRVYVSFSDLLENIEDYFSNIEERYYSHTRNYLIGSIEIQTLQYAPWNNHKNVSIVAFDESPIRNVENDFVLNGAIALHDEY